MRRRRFLAGVTLTSTALVAGCLGDGLDDGTVLSMTDREEQAENFPVNGDELPSAEAPAPHHDTTVATDGFVGERETLLTFVFSRCPGPCHTLVSSLAHAQVAAEDDGYADEVALMPVTFDPEHDTPSVLADFCEANGADPHADNWYTLRPETPADAKAFTQDTFGVFFEEVPMEESGHGDHGDHDDHGEHDMTFNHVNLVVLANRDGYVERSYFGSTADTNDPDPEITPARILDDLETVRDHFG